ncbi:MAG: glycosyltransferase [Lachnospiraceae bacterium]|nr:glycosyltransferase [Lachnospiraceae bacterium]
MQIAIINTLAKHKSIGKISYGLQQYMRSKGHNAYIFYGREYEEKDNDPYLIRIGNDFDLRMHGGLSRVFGGEGTYSKLATYKMLKTFEELNIEAVCLLNIHGYYLNQPLLFKWLGEHKTRLIYVMLDEYPFLGKCTYSYECNKFMTKCEKCPHYKEYPKSWFIDCSTRMFELKRKMYKLVPQCIFVGIEYTVERAKKSALCKNATFFVADEAVDLRNVYYPRNTEELRKELGIPLDNKIIVTVSPFPNARKGSINFFNAAKLLEHNKNISFVHVGFKADTKICPSNYYPIGYVKDQDLLASYYSLGDLFVQTSTAETIPAACLEALSCGTPVLGFNSSGIPYCADEKHGTFVEKDNVDELARVILNTPKKDDTVISSCRKYAELRYDSIEYYKKLTDLLTD